MIPFQERPLKTCLRRCGKGEGSADKIIESKGLKQMTDTGEIETIVMRLLPITPAS